MFHGATLRGQCRKLHVRLVVATFFVGWSGVAPARAGETGSAELPRLLTRDDRATLRDELAAHVVEIHRLIPPPKGMVAPIPDVRSGQGLCVAPGRILTARALVADWPLPNRAAEDHITVQVVGGVPSTASVEWQDTALGLAILNVKDAKGVPLESARCKPFGSPPTAWDTGNGLVLYTAYLGDSTLREVATRGQGPDFRAWFVMADGDVVPLGTPLFSSRGRFVSVVGELDTETPGRSFLVPSAALAAMLAERSLWVP